MRYILSTGVFALLLASCVGRKDFTVHTAPEGATVTINGKLQEGVTPLTTTIHQDKDLGIVVRKKGYETTSATVQTRPHRLMGIIWTQNDPRARYIEEDEITIHMTRIPGLSEYQPGKMPAFDGKTLPPAPIKTPKKGGDVPSLRPMPADL